MSVGAAGGPTIISQVVQTLLNRLGLGMSPEQAIAAVRVHHQWRPDGAYIDGFAETELMESLRAKGHKLKDWPPFGATQAIVLDGGRFTAVAEPRLDTRK